MAQIERWRQAYHMQVERERVESLLSMLTSGGRVSKAWGAGFWRGITIGNDG